jgi:hypothetical protein
VRADQTTSCSRRQPPARGVSTVGRNSPSGGRPEWPRPCGVVDDDRTRHRTDRLADGQLFIPVPGGEFDQQIVQRSPVGLFPGTDGWRSSFIVPLQTIGWSSWVAKTPGSSPSGPATDLNRFERLSIHHC